MVGAGVSVEQDVELLPELSAMAKDNRQPKKTPVRYSPEIAERILEGIMNGKGLNTVCQGDDMPTEHAVREWVQDDVDGFASKYARARAIQAERFADELIQLADRASDSETAQVQRLKIDTRKWVISKILPKKYGDKVEVENTGEVKHTVSFK